MESLNWFEIWRDDKNAMVATMARNIAADLESGYNPREDHTMRVDFDSSAIF